MWFKDRRIRTSLLAITSDSLLFALKLGIALVTGSTALYADALHSATDLLISLVLLVGIGIRYRQEKRASALGVARAYRLEAILAILVSLTILWVPYEIVTSVDQSKSGEIQFIWLGIVGVMVAIVLAHVMATLKTRVGQDTDSPALEADGYHSYIDMFTSFAVLGSFVGLLVGINIDQIVALVIALMVAFAGIELFISGVRSFINGSEVAPDGLIERLLEQPFWQRAAQRIKRHRSGVLVSFLVGALVFYAGSGLHVVRSDENAVYRIFGQPQPEVLTPGLHLLAPWPIGAIERYRPQQVYRLEVGTPLALWDHSNVFSRSQWQTLGNVNLDREHHYLFADENLVNLTLTVQYQLPKLGFESRQIAQPHQLVAAAVEQTVSHLLSQAPFTLNLADSFETTAIAQVEQRLEAYGLSTRIGSITVQKLQPPSAVVSAYHDLERAAEQQQALQHQVQGERVEELAANRARLSREAAETSAKIAELEAGAAGDAAYFATLAGEYAQQPELVAFNKRLELSERVLPQIEKVITEDALRSRDTRLFGDYQP